MQRDWTKYLVNDKRAWEKLEDRKATPKNSLQKITLSEQTRKKLIEKLRYHDEFKTESRKYGHQCVR